MSDVSLSSKLLLNTLSFRVEDCSVNLVGNVIFGKNPTVIKLSKKSLKCLFLSLTNQCYNRHKVVQVLCIHYKVDTFENKVHGVITQYISYPIQLLLDVLYRPVCT